MEEGLHLPERHQAGLVADGRDLVADHVSDWETDAAALWGEKAGLAHNLGHPSSAALLSGPGVWVQEEVSLGGSRMDGDEGACVGLRTLFWLRLIGGCGWESPGCGMSEPGCRSFVSQAI